MQVNYTKLNRLVTSDKKKIFCDNEPDLLCNLWPFIKKYMDYLENLSVYEVSSIFLGIGHWEKSRKSHQRVEAIPKKDRPKPWRYEIGDIIFLELGASNYGYEASYNHPCIVLANGWDWVLVIPCSTGRYAVKSTHIIPAEKSDGFLHSTGIQLDKIRIVDKWRIRGKRVGKLANPKLIEVSNKLLELYFEPFKKRLDYLEQEKVNWEKEKIDLETKLRELEDEIQLLKSK